MDSTSRPQPSGYTSDQSDVAHRPRPRRNRPDSGRSVGNDTCAPVHTQPRFSLLSSERINVSNQSGLLTLMFIVVAATNFRLILENMIKYGLRFNPFTFVKEAVTPKGNTMLLLCWPSLALFTLAALGIEKIAANFLMSELKVREVCNALHMLRHLRETLLYSSS